ncbi:hypothetical protein [Paraglaciecola sp. L3A3]|uniref:hypothetical protein n=1 Tax=Paraglaciecola sp. L3A3 TaxID=2686358 RepID=UPI00131DF447|nr:hypothetical protein [Paraglaciecola sp. L3A3]
MQLLTKLFLIVMTSMIISCGDNASSEQAAKAEQSINLISYKVLNRSEMSTFKVSYDIEVPLVNNKLPTEEQLGAISNHLISKEATHDKSFVLFYLPRMKIGHGAYASAHHAPTMQVKVMDFSLIDYSEYHHFIPEIVKALSN